MGLHFEETANCKVTVQLTVFVFISVVIVINRAFGAICAISRFVQQQEQQQQQQQ